jgi:uncharacterized protein
VKTVKYSDPIRIRAHHLLCIQGFQGYGYTPDFERHMANIVNLLNLDPSVKLQIIAGTDEICCHCPYEINGLCERYSDSQEGIVKVDNLVIDKAVFVENKIYSFQNAINLIDNNLSHEDVTEICFKCSWKDKCLFFIKKTGL